MYEQNILGGEAAMWSEQVEGVAVEAKLWPRVAALGERLWADPESGKMDDACAIYVQLLI